MRHQEASQVAALKYTGHGRLRKDQRCKNDRLVDLLLSHFDRDVYLRDGKWAWSVTRARCQQLKKRGVISPAEAERLPTLVIVTGDDDGSVVTLVRGRGSELGQYLSRH